MEDNRKALQLNALIDYFAGGKKAEFARMLGTSPQGVNTWLSRNTFDIELIYSKCEGVSAEWLLTGKGEMIEKKIEENVSPKLSAQNVSPKGENVSPKRKPKDFGTASDMGGELSSPENVFSGLTQEEVDKELQEGIRAYILDMYENGRAYPAAMVGQFQEQIKELTTQVARLEYKNGELLAELAALRGKTGASKASKAPGKGVTGEK